MADPNKFAASIGKHSTVFARDIGYDECINTIENDLIVEDGEMRFYRPNIGSTRDRERKPLNHLIELTTLVQKYGDVCVELTIKNQATIPTYRPRCTHYTKR